MTDFGDWEPDDAYDREPADPDQIEVKREQLRRLRTLDVEAAIRVWLARQGAD